MKALLQQALDFCVFCWRDVDMNDYAFERLETTIDALRAELAKPDPTPTWYHCIGSHGEHRFYDNVEEQPEGCTPLYSAPAEPNCRFPVCHSQEYQEKLADEITKEQL